MTRKKRIKILNNIKIQKIGYGGIGISRAPGGKTILIKGGALPGTTVDLRILKEKKRLYRSSYSFCSQTQSRTFEWDSNL